MLARVNMTPREALEITWQANEVLQRAETTALKGYVIQGYDLRWYQDSIDVALASPQAADVATGRAVWIIGSVCLARPAKVMAVADLCQQLPGPKHMLGQGRPGVITELRKRGFPWADSGTAAGYAAFAKWLFPKGNGDFGWRRIHDGRPLSRPLYGFLVRNNVEVLDICIDQISA